MVRRWIGEQGKGTVASEFFAEDQQAVMAQASARLLTSSGRGRYIFSSPTGLAGSGGVLGFAGKAGCRMAPVLTASREYGSLEESAEQSGWSFGRMRFSVVIPCYDAKQFILTSLHARPIGGCFPMRSSLSMMDLVMPV